jgi:putative ABC transport system substrate-binding protein
MNRREFIALIGGAMAWPLGARAQQPAKVLQIGFLYPGNQAAALLRIKAVLTGLQAGGLRAPDQLTVIPAVTGGAAELLNPMAADLVARKVDLILAQSSAAVRAAQAATTTIPIVALDLESDPVASGFIATNARPGGNITGVFLDFPDFSKKWLEALKETVPKVSRVAVFWDPAMASLQLRAVEAAAQTLNLKLAVFEVRGWGDIEPAFQSAANQGAEALLMLASPLIGGNTKLLAEMTVMHRLPAITVFTDFARHGGLMAYGPNLQTFLRQQGVLAAKILQGSKPAETPIEAPTKFEFVVNFRTAELLGITVPASILLRADEVID